MKAAHCKASKTIMITNLQAKEQKQDVISEVKEL
jgi:hypothetical protein